MQFEKGQSVYWPHAPSHLAQVVEIRRTCVRIYYRTKKHRRERQPIVNAGVLAELQKAPLPAQPPLPFHNPFRRAQMKPRRKAM